MTDNLHTGTETRDKLFAGIKKISDAVGATMGSAGINGLIETIESPGHRLTNDGITIAESIHLADPIEDMGRKILLEAISRANKQSGDGSSTTCVLTSAILEEGMKHTDISPMQLKAELEACVPLIEESINKQKRMITVDEVEPVATIAAESPEIGKMIQEIYTQIGKEGIIHWDISKTFADYYTIGKGITIEGAGFVSPYMADLREDGTFESTARWTNPSILMVKQKITSAADFNDLFQTLFAKDIKEIVVFCDDYEANVVADLIKTRAVRGFKTLLIKMPVLFKDWYFTDIAKATGATVIDPVAGISLKQMTIGHLGQVEHITVDKDTTYLDGIKDVSEYIKELEAEGSDDSLIRATRLNTKTARYFVGAPSESALSHRRYKVEDAINSAYQALQNGVVAGGGVALYKAGHSLNPTESIGKSILNAALDVPQNQIIKNASITAEYIEPFSDKGFNTKTGEYTDMFDAGIVDAANVVLNSAKNAISVAASILTASVVVLYPRPDLTEQLIQSILSRRP